MIIIAGIVNFEKEEVVQQEERHALQALLSRKKLGDIHAFYDENYFITAVSFHKINIQQHCCQDNDSITFLAGNPYLENCRKFISSEPNKQVYVLHDLFKKNDWNILNNNARGVFLAIHYNKKNNQLFLLTDKLGIRPLYYWCNNNKVVFSSAFRVLEAYPFVSRTLDVQGMS